MTETSTLNVPPHAFSGPLAFLEPGEYLRDTRRGVSWEVVSFDKDAGTIEVKKPSLAVSR